MAKGALRDMTTGSPIKLILGFLGPMLCGLLFQQFYNMVDLIVVGKFLGVQALAGVGSISSITFLVVGFCMGVCNGFAIPIAHKFGEHDYAGLRRFATNAIWLAAGFAVVITLTTCLLCKQILGWMNTPEDIFNHAFNYIFVIFLGIPVVFAYNVLSGIIRSMGDSKTPVIYLMVTSVLNIVLDIVAVLVLNMGVEGTAWATVISQLVSTLLCMRYIRHCDVLIIQKEEWRPQKSILGKLCAMGLPMGLQYSITGIGSIVLQSAVNGLGSIAVASVTTGGKVGQLFNCAFDAMGSTMATYGGQNVGARRLDRIREGVKGCSLIGIGYAIFVFIILYLFGDKLALFFIDANEVEVVANAHRFLILSSAFYIPLAFVNILRFLIQGLGFSNRAVFAGGFEMIARAGLALFFVPVYGFDAACFAGPAAWVLADLFLVPTYFHAMKTLEARFEKEDACAKLAGDQIS